LKNPNAMNILNNAVVFSQYRTLQSVSLFSGKTMIYDKAEYET